MATVKIGRSYRKITSNEQVAKDIGTELARFVKDRAIENINKRGPIIAARMELSARRELLKIGSYMADNLIGLASRGPTTVEREDGIGSEGYRSLGAGLFNRGAPDLPYAFRSTQSIFSEHANFRSQELEWKVLSHRTWKKKKKLGRKNPSGFFEDTGTLKKYFQRLASRAILAGTGGVKVVYVSKYKNDSLVANDIRTKHLAGSIHIQMAPKVTAQGLPQLQDGDWSGDSNQNMPLEKRWFPTEITNKLMPKLRGSNKPDYSAFRPLVQPTLAFWLLHRVPRALISAFSRGISSTRGVK